MSRSSVLMCTLFLGIGIQTAMSAPVELTEKKILELTKAENVPSINQIKATFLQAKYDNGAALDNLNYEAYAGHNHLATKEKGTISLNPVFTNINQYQIGLSKSLRYGAQLDLSATTDSRSGSSSISSYKDLTTTTYALEVNLDLWQDLFGRTTRKELDNANMAQKKAKLESEISLKTFEVSLRRIYWALVANNEKILITESLHKTAKNQAAQARRRRANSIADKGEVARYESQVAARKGSLLLLEYEKEGYLKQLRNLLPSLNGKDVSLGNYSLNKTVFQVLECTALIESKESVPYEYTQYDELTSLLKAVQSNQTSIDKNYDDIDIQLSTTFKQTGVGSDGSEGSYDDSITDLSDNDRSGIETGLLVTIPFGGAKRGVEDVLVEMNKRKLQASIDNVDGNLMASHRQISRSIKILSEVIKTQKVNSKKLTTRLNSMQRKYNQARIPVSALIQDQDALFSSDLSIVDTQLAILNTLLDYIVVFTDTPCSFNKI